MPFSLVLNLVPEKSLLPGYLEGRHLHALFLSMVSSFDLELGTRLHQDSADKAFTLSPLQCRPPQSLQGYHAKAIAAETPCWWRISLLDDALFGHLAPLWLNLNPRQAWHLGPTNLVITSVLGTPQSTQPWANSLSYTELFERASDSERWIKLRFHTPTAFRQGQYDTALPSAELVFGSLASRWQKYSDVPLAEDLKDLVRSHLFPCSFDIHTEMIPDRRSKFIGCLGTITYQVLGELLPLQLKQLNALADYAMFCGVGRKTTMGMGMTRRVDA